MPRTRRVRLRAARGKNNWKEGKGRLSSYIVPFALDRGIGQGNGYTNVQQKKVFGNPPSFPFSFLPMSLRAYALCFPSSGKRSIYYTAPLFLSSSGYYAMVLCISIIIIILHNQTKSEEAARWVCCCCCWSTLSCVTLTHFFLCTSTPSPGGQSVWSVAMPVTFYLGPIIVNHTPREW